MQDLFTPGYIIVSIIAFVVGDLLVRGVLRFIDMTPDEKRHGAKNIKTGFMLSFPVGILSLIITFLLPDGLVWSSMTIKATV